MQDSSRLKVQFVDRVEGFKFEVLRSASNDAMILDKFTQEAFKAFGDIFTEGLSLHNAVNEQAITSAITNASDLLWLVLENYGSSCSSFKCILASSVSHMQGIEFVSKHKRISNNIFSQNYVILASKIYVAMRKTQAGNANGSNIYRQVHCIVNRGGNTNLIQPYAYAMFTVLLQAAMFSYVFAHSVTNLPRYEESMLNLPLALVVVVYQMLLLMPEVRDTLALGASGFWDCGRYSVLRFFDVVSNIVMPLVLLPIGVMLVLTSENLLEAVLSSTAVLFIPTLDNDIISLMGGADRDTVKKHVVQETIHDIADHFFRFQIAFEESDGFADLEGGGGGYGSTACGCEGSSVTPDRRLLEDEAAELSAEPVLVDLVITGQDALLKCVVFDAFSTTRSLAHLHAASQSRKLVLQDRSSSSTSTSNSNTYSHLQRSTAGFTTPIKCNRTREGFSEIPRDSYHEVFFSESAVVSTSSLFTHMEYKIDDQAPYSILYLKLWRLGGHPLHNTVEYRTKRYSDLYPTRRIEPGCFVITNIAITDCIDTLRLCWAPTAPALLQALNYYTIFKCDDAADGVLRRDKTTRVYAKNAVRSQRRRSTLAQQLQESYQSGV